MSSRRSHVHRGWASLGLIAAVLTVAAASAEAQTSGEARPQRPNRALFGGGRGDAAQSLIASGNLGLGRDMLLSGGMFDPNDPTVAAADRITDFASGSADLAYSISRTSVNFSANVGSSARYLPGIDNSVVSSHSAGMDLSVAVTKRTSVSALFSAGYAPLSASTYFPGLFQADGRPPLPTDYDLGAQAFNYSSYTGAFTVSQAISKRTGLSVGYQTGYWKAPSTNNGQRQEEVNAGISHALARGIGLRLGYGRRAAHVDVAGSPEIVWQHSIDAGVDYNRALSISRQTQLSFATGSAIVSDGSQSRYDFTGALNLDHQFGRTWTTGVALSRQVGYLDTVLQPTFSNSLSASLTGLLSRRFSVNLGTGVADGSIGLTGPGNEYRAYRGSAGLAGAFTEFLAVSVDYVYYTYEFNSPQFLPTAVGTHLSRQSVQVSLSTSIPLIYRARRANAAR